MLFGMSLSILLLPIVFGLWQNDDVYHNPTCSGKPSQWTSFATDDGCTPHGCQAIDGKPNFWSITSCGNPRASPIGNLNQVLYYDSSCTNAAAYYSMELSCQIGDDNHGTFYGCTGNTGTLTEYTNGDCTGAVVDSSVIPLNQCQFNTTWSCASACSIHSCSWYQNCLESLHPCQTDNYAIDYGLFFCSRYQDFATLLSSQAITWKDTVMSCLQEKLLTLMNKNPNFATTISCSSLKQYAFDSHPSCYTDSGACTLMYPSDWKAIAQIICGDRYCSLQGDKLLFLKQVLNTGIICLGKLASSISLTVKTATLAIEAASKFIEVMERLMNSALKSETAFSNRVIINAIDQAFPIRPSSSTTNNKPMTLLSTTTQTLLFDFLILPPFETNTTSSNSSNSSSLTNLTSSELASTISRILLENPMVVEDQEVVALSVDNQTVFQPVSAGLVVLPFSRLVHVLLVMSLLSLMF